MKFRKIFGMVLIAVLLTGNCICADITATAATIHKDSGKYFYFCMEYTDFDGTDESRYYDYDGDYCDKCRLINPVKVYSDGFYDCNGAFIRFSDIWGNDSENISVDLSNRDEIDTVAEGVELLLAYYSNQELYDVCSTDENNYDWGFVNINDYEMSDGFLSSVDTAVGEFDYTQFAFFEGGKCADKGMEDYRWSNNTMPEKGVFRIICDRWEDLIFYSYDYVPEPGDALIRAVGDYYEQLTEKAPGIETAREQYEAAMAGYYGRDNEETAAALSKALPGLNEASATAGNVVINILPKRNGSLVPNSGVKLAAVVSDCVGNLSYQWYCDENIIEGANESVYNFTGAKSGKHKYKVKVTASISEQNKAFAEKEIEITIYSVPEITINGGNEINAVYGEEEIIAAEVIYDEINYPQNTVSCQWYSSDTESFIAKSKVSGGESSRLTIPTSEYGVKYYRLYATDSGNNTVQSEILKVTVVPEYDENGWDGTFDRYDDEPEMNFDTMTYKIGTPQELAWYADYVNQAAAESINSYITPYNAELTANIDLNSRKWTPIGKYEKRAAYFTLDGKGHTISNLFSCEGNGLFGGLGNKDTGKWDIKGKRTYIKNLTVEGTVKGSGSTAIIAPDAESTEFSNVAVRGKVINTSGNKGNAAGIAAEENGCVFENCRNFAEITFTKSINGIAGGITAYQKKTWGWGGTAWCDWDYTENCRTRIADCINFGTIIGGGRRDPIIAVISNKDNNYADYRDMSGASNISYEIQEAVSLENNLYIYASSPQECIIQNLNKDSYKTAEAVSVAECGDEKAIIDILRNTLTETNGVLSGKVEMYINNKNTLLKNGNVILALYDVDGALIKFFAMTKSISYGENYICFDNISIKHKGAYKIGAMLWSDMNTLIPLAEDAEKEIK